MQRMRWLKRKKTAPDLPLEPPIRLGNMSNGEFFHESTPREQKIRHEILRQADENARRLGMDRREFLASAMGMCTSLSVLNLASGCSDTFESSARARRSCADPISDCLQLRCRRQQVRQTRPWHSQTETLLRSLTTAQHRRSPFRLRR